MKFTFVLTDNTQLKVEAQTASMAKHSAIEELMRKRQIKYTTARELLDEERTPKK